MLKSLWLRLPSPGPSASEEQALARYFHDEGLHAELETLRAQREGAHSGYERILHAARSYFPA
jgi:hypothetical protein